jgi:hypothetical protein
MRVPANIIEAKYTSGNEFVFALNYKYYQGYYYELNGKTFVGKEFNANSPELIKSNSDNVNTLLTDSKTYIYGFLSKIKINNQKIPSFFFKYESNIRYFITNPNIKPTLIKEINKETFNQIQNDSLYLSVSLSYDGGFSDKELNEAEIKIPGIKTFVNTSYTNPSVEESGLVG